MPTIKELRKLAKEKGVKRYSKLTKKELLDVLAIEKKIDYSNMNTDFLENSKVILKDEYTKLKYEDRKKFNYIIYELTKSPRCMFIHSHYYKQGERNTNVSPQMCAFQMKDKMKSDIVVQCMENRSYSFMTFNQLFEVLEKKNWYLAEVIQNKNRRKIYFDIDGNSPKPKEFIINKIKEILPNAEFSISGSETKKRHSYHIVVNNYYFTDKESMLGFVCWCNKLIEEGEITKKELDISVYYSNSLMKCINQSKSHNDTKRKQKNMTGDDIKNHIIQYLTGDEICADDLFSNFISRDMKVIKKKITRGQKITKTEKAKMDGKFSEYMGNIQKSNKDIPSINIQKARAKVLLNTIDPEHLTYPVFVIICMWCKKEDVKYADFYKWGSSPWGFNKQFYKQWREIYDGFDKSKINITRKHIKLILEQQYGEICDKKQEQFFNSFYDTDRKIQMGGLIGPRLKPSELVNDRYIPVDTLKGIYDNNKIILENVGMGSGKTYSNIELLKKLCVYDPMNNHKKLIQKKIIYEPDRDDYICDYILKWEEEAEEGDEKAIELLEEYADELEEGQKDYEEAMKEYEKEKNETIVSYVKTDKWISREEFESTSPSVLWITHRISLKDDITNKIQKEIPNFVDYKTRRDGLNVEWTPANFNDKKQKLLICGLHSLHKWIEECYDEFDIVVVDEVESIEFAFLNNKCFGGGLGSIDRIDRYRDCYNLMVYALMFSKKIFMMDAFISRRTTRWLENLGFDKEDMCILTKERKNEQGRTITYYIDKSGKGGAGFYRWYDDIVKDLKEGKKLYVYYPHKKGTGSFIKKGIAELGKLMCVDAGLDEDDLIIHHSGHKNNEKLRLMGVNECWGGKKLIIVNSCISVGVSYELEDVDKIYICYDDFIPPRDVLQTSNRIRKPKDKNIGFCSLLPMRLLCNGFVPDETEIPFYKPDEIINDTIQWTNYMKDMEDDDKIVKERRDRMRKGLIELYEDICLEYDCIGEECLSEFWKIAGIKENGILYGDMKYGKKFKKIVAEHPEIESPVVEYDVIQNINRKQHDKLQTKIQSGKATEMNLYECDKYINERTFHDKTEKKIKKAFWSSPELRHGFKFMRELNKLLLYVFHINIDNWDTKWKRGKKRNDDKERNAMMMEDKPENRVNIVEEDDIEIGEIISLNTTELTQEDRNFIFDRLYMNNEGSDLIIRKNIINFFFGKGWYEKTDKKEQNKNCKNGTIALCDMFYYLLGEYIKNSRKTIVSKQEKKKKPILEFSKGICLIDDE